MSRMSRFIRKVVVPLVISAAALAGGYLAVAGNGAQADAGSSSVASSVSANDLAWT